MIQNYEVMRRRKGEFDGRLPDVSVYEKRRFTFRVNDTLFYTNLGPNTLIFFASDQANQALPTWLNFNPISNTFYGVAPLGPLTIPVMITGLNQESQDTNTIVFHIDVIKSPLPRTWVEAL